MLSNMKGVRVLCFKLGDSYELGYLSDLVVIKRAQ